jgi:DNA primase
VEKLIFFFDSDKAGKTAALKGIYTCRRNGIACALVSAAKDSGEILKNSGAENEVLKDPSDILKLYGPEALQKKAKCFINDFDYLLLEAGTLYDITNSEGKAQAVAFLFPYIGLLDSEVARNSCFELAADSFGLLPEVIVEDYRRYASGQRPAADEERRSSKKEELSGQQEVKPSIRMNFELFLLIAAAIDYLSSGGGKLFQKFRAALEINEIEDPYAKELFIALEECIRYGENTIDELLARVSSAELRKNILERSVSGEFSANSGQIVADGIKKIREKRLRHSQEEIIVKLRLIKKAGEEERNAKEKELLAEKMLIDDELFNLKQGKQV